MNPIHRYLATGYQTNKPHRKVPSYKYISELLINTPNMYCAYYVQALFYALGTRQWRKHPSVREFTFRYSGPIYIKALC